MLGAQEVTILVDLGGAPEAGRPGDRLGLRPELRVRPHQRRLQDIRVGRLGNTTTNDKAALLAQALPYIQRYQGKTIVVKYGGAAMVNESLRAAVAEDLVLMSCVGIRDGPRARRRARDRRDAAPPGQGAGLRRRPAIYRRGDDGSRADGPRGQGQQGPRRASSSAPGGKALGPQRPGRRPAVGRAARRGPGAHEDLGLVGEIRKVNASPARGRAGRRLSSRSSPRSPAGSAAIPNRIT